MVKMVGFMLCLSYRNENSLKENRHFRKRDKDSIRFPMQKLRCSGQRRSRILRSGLRGGDWLLAVRQKGLRTRSKLQQRHM